MSFYELLILSISSFLCRIMRVSDGTTHYMLESISTVFLVELMPSNPLMSLMSKFGRMNFEIENKHIAREGYKKKYASWALLVFSKICR